MRAHRATPLILALLVLVGCASQPESSPGPGGSGSPLPSVSPSTPTPDASSSTPGASTSPAATASQAPPELLLDGRCDGIATDAEASAVVGAPVATLAVPFPADVALNVPGGFSCRWQGADGRLAMSVYVWPASLTPQLASGVGCSASPAWRCAFTFVSDGYVFTGGADVDPTTASAAVTQLGVRLAALARASGVPAAYTPPEGAWQRADCVSLNIEADLPRVIESPTVKARSTEPLESDRVPLFEAIGRTGCEWTDWVEAFGFTIEAMPAGWAMDVAESLPGARVVNVEGSERAVAVPANAFGLEYTYVSDGVNLLVVKPKYAITSAAAVERNAAALLSALD